MYSDHLAQKLAKLASSRPLLLALDFDGTLSWHTEHPEDAVMIAASRKILDEFTHMPDTQIALVSGRGLADLKLRADPHPNWHLIGSHGGEIQFGRQIPAAEAAEAHEVNLPAELVLAIENLQNQYEGAVIERKPQGIAIHYRMVAKNHQAEILHKGEDLAKDFPDLLFRTAVLAFEYALTSVNKGHALAELKSAVNPTAVFFAGDDVTDEDGFAVLTGADFGVKIGRSTTIAAHQVADPDEFTGLLQELLRLRKSKIAQQQFDN